MQFAPKQVCFHYRKYNCSNTDTLNGRLGTSHEMEGIQKFACIVAIHNWNATMKIYYRNGGIYYNGKKVGT